MCVNAVTTFTCGHNRVLNTVFCCDAILHPKSEISYRKLALRWFLSKVNYTISRSLTCIKPYPGLDTNPRPPATPTTACERISNDISIKSCLCTSCLAVLASGTEDEIIKFQLEHDTNRYFWTDWLDFVMYQTTPKYRPSALKHREMAQAREIFKQLRNSIFRVDEEKDLEEGCNLLRPV